MNKPNRAQLLAESFREAVRAAEEERDFQAHVARVAAIAQPEIDKILAQYKAETSKSYACPSCGAVLEGWRPDEATSGVNDDDEDDDNDYDNRRPIDRLNALARRMVAATNKGSNK